MQRTFTHAAHKNGIKSLAAAGQYLASGGADDLIHIYDMKVLATTPNFPKGCHA
jgi:hypothetical protein